MRKAILSPSRQWHFSVKANIRIKVISFDKNWKSSEMKIPERRLVSGGGTLKDVPIAADVL